MSRLDSFFNKGFKAATCKTLLKLTISRIKLLSNRREIHLKQMRRDIAKLLETGQEATSRIRVEHIVREEKMMAAQEIIELFSELITVRLPIIESQRECPLDLKEAISSICFAAPRCTDLPELIQVQMLFVGKYGKEFVQAAMELMPECGVNRQLIELLSVRAPAPDVKLKLLKDIAEEHELDWDPAASESELLKPHEDLLNGPAQFVSGTELPLPEEKIDDAVLYSASAQVPLDQTNSDEKSDFPEVPKASQHSSTGTGMAPEMFHFPASALSGLDPDSPYSGDDETHSHKLNSEPNELPQEKLESKEPPNTLVRLSEDKQFLPFISPPPLSSSSSETQQNPLPSVSRTNSEVNVERQPNPLPSVPRTTSEDNVEKQIKPLPSVLRTNTEVDVDLQDVLAAASSSEHAAAAARTAATPAQVRIDELVKKRNVENSDTRDNPFHAAISQSDTVDRPPTLNHVNSFTDSVVSSSPHLDLDLGHRPTSNTERLPQSDNLESNSDPHISGNLGPDQDRLEQQPQRSNSIDDDSYMPIPNLFTHGSKSVSGTPLFDDKFDSAGKH